MRRAPYLIVVIALSSAIVACDKKRAAPNLEKLSHKPLEIQLKIAGRRVQPCVDDWLAAQIALLGDDIVETKAFVKSREGQRRGYNEPGTGEGILSVFEDRPYSVRAVVECWNESPCAAFALCAVKRIDAHDLARSEEMWRQAEEERRASESEEVPQRRNHPPGRAEDITPELGASDS